MVMKTHVSVIRLHPAPRLLKRWLRFEMMDNMPNRNTIKKESLQLNLLSFWNVKANGILVELVTISPCHGEGHGFESRIFRWLVLFWLL